VRGVCLVRTTVDRSTLYSSLAVAAPSPSSPAPALERVVSEQRQRIECWWRRCHYFKSPITKSLDADTYILCAVESALGIRCAPFIPQTMVQITVDSISPSTHRERTVLAVQRVLPLIDSCLSRSSSNPTVLSTVQYCPIFSRFGLSSPPGLLPGASPSACWNKQSSSNISGKVYLAVCRGCSMSCANTDAVFRRVVEDHLAGISGRRRKDPCPLSIIKHFNCHGVLVIQS
jgi:hypothetical protein